jgi:uncharacterized protein
MSEKNNQDIPSKQGGPGNDEESIMEFPCEFCYKVFGKNNPEFIESVKKIFAKYHPEVAQGSWQQKESKDKNYLSISITVQAESKQKLDQVYQAMTDDENILMSM